MIGTLFFNQDRPDIISDAGIMYGGLHCGECFRCFLDGKWIDVRLEYNDGWILVHTGRTMPVCYGAKVQI